MIDTKKLKTARDCLTKSRWGIDDILSNPDASGALEKQIGFVVKSLEIAIGNICDFSQTIESPNISKISKPNKIEVNLTPENWLNIRINSLLPNTRAVNSAELLAIQIKSALAEFSEQNRLTKYDKAFIGIIEHTNVQSMSTKTLHRRF